MVATVNRFVTAPLRPIIQGHLTQYLSLVALHRVMPHGMSTTLKDRVNTELRAMGACR